MSLLRSNVGYGWRHESSFDFVSELRCGIRGGGVRDISLTACRSIGISCRRRYENRCGAGWPLRPAWTKRPNVFRATSNPAFQRTGKSCVFPATELTR